MVNLASSYLHLGRYKDALILYEKALAIYNFVLSEDDPQIGVT
jgi:hypothetical protein